MLIRSIRPDARNPFGILANRRGHFVQCLAKGRRFVVEWRENHGWGDFATFDHWRAQDRKRLTALTAPYTPTGIPAGRDPDWLTYADTLRTATPVSPAFAPKAASRSCRSADWQSAVSRVGNPQTTRKPAAPSAIRTPSRVPLGDTADCQSALPTTRSASVRSADWESAVSRIGNPQARPPSTGAPEHSQPVPSATRRYSRLPICATFLPQVRRRPRAAQWVLPGHFRLSARQ